MKGRLFPMIMILLAGLIISLPSPARAADSTLTDTVVMACRVLVDGFQHTLKGELMSAVKAGGPAHAIRVCRETAPAVAESYSSLDGWSVRRTALRRRNPLNAPDTFETMVMHKLRDGGGHEYYEWVTDSTGQHFRYLAVIKMGGVCIPCHGTRAQIADTVRTIIAQNYPDDQAVNFKAGELRGAFSIVVDWPTGRPATDSLWSEAKKKTGKTGTSGR